jgi:hypothetical protein
MGAVWFLERRRRTCGSVPRGRAFSTLLLYLKYTIESGQNRPFFHLMPAANSHRPIGMDLSPASREAGKIVGALTSLVLERVRKGF